MILPDSAIIDVFGRGPKLFLMEERHPEINNGTIIHYSGLNYFVQEVVEGSRGRFGLKVTEHGN
jgi:hypothetical protein